uniref:ARAD1C13860p n=1 Tax=Blastobotrys adeninivorans TaxID=409370 RepID=A0A060T053_BLAAD
MLTNVLNYIRDLEVPGLSSPRAIKFRGSKFFIVVTITMAVFTDIFLYGVIVPVIPFAFEQRMGVSADATQLWVSKSLAVYGAAMAVGSIVFGYLSDRLGNRRAAMLGGLLVLIAATLILCLCKTLALFMVGRVLQGLSAAVVWSVGLAVIADTAESNEVAYYMAYPGIGLSLGTFFGPLLGGIVYDKAGYYAVFYLCFALIALDIILRLLMIEREALVQKLRKISPEISDLATDEGIKNSTIMQPDVEQQSLPNKDDEGAEDHEIVETDVEQQPVPDMVSSGELSPCPAKSRGKILSNLPPIFLLLSSPRILTAVFQSFTLAWIMSSFDATLTIHLKDLFGFSSLGASLMLLAVAAPSVVEPLVGKVADRFGPRPVIIFGLVLIGLFLILLRLPDHKSTQQIVEFAALLTMAGLGIICVFSPMLGELSNATLKIESRKKGIFGPGKGFGQAYGLFNVAFSLGSIVGPFQSGATNDNQGWGMTSLSLGIVAFVTLIPSILFSGGNMLVRNKTTTPQA